MPCLELLTGLEILIVWLKNQKKKYGQIDDVDRLDTGKLASLNTSANWLHEGIPCLLLFLKHGHEILLNYLYNWTAVNIELTS